MLTAVIQFIYSAHAIPTAPITLNILIPTPHVQRIGKIERDIKETRWYLYDRSSNRHTEL